MTTIALDFRALPETGIDHYTKALAARLPLYMAGLDIYPLRSTMEIAPTRWNRIKRGVLRVGHEMFSLERSLRKAGVDLFHCTKNYGVPLGGDLPVVTTVHDIIPLVLRHDYSRAFAKFQYFRWNFMNSLKVSKKIITISDFSRDEICRYAPFVRDKVAVVPQGCDQQYGAGMSKEAALRIMATHGVTRPYILTMGGAEPRKNVAMLQNVHADNAAALPQDLVIIGGEWYGRRLPVSSRKDQVHTLQKVPAAVVVAAYTAAEAFVFPSLYEGFGLPVLEAMACGAPVLAHDGSSLRQVVGDAGLLADMRSPESCLQALQRLLSEASLRQELVQAGAAQVKRFTWEETARQTAAIYAAALG